MRSQSYSHDPNSGFTLIETIIYIVLLSGLMSSFIQYAYSIHEENMRLRSEIEITARE